MVHTTTTNAPPALSRALQEFLQRRRSDRPVSIADMMQRSRCALPKLALNDDELEQIIVEKVIERRENVAFDRRVIDQIAADAKLKRKPC